MITACIEPRVIPTYPVGAPEKNPMFFEKRVYQGSNGKVYPVPFVDKVFDERVPVTYQAVRLENEFVRLVLLPEIGGRILIGQDKTNDDYDFFYRQDVIKPALVGLAGPWISGGVEFNWPQHHRPGTYMPADVHLEREPNGACTAWFSEHDPLNRMKGMHGIRLQPGSSLIELRVRLYNRTPIGQTFLWWANAAARVHDQYESFFPPDVHYVADHAVRDMSSFPIATGAYYGIPYQERFGANDLSWYKNIPVPTSYMVCQTNFDFFGGYDHSKNGGFVHVADRHIAPGKKQWTWGNDQFGWAWDRELTDAGGPYIELMAGVYTDNQPDFSYLQPYETKRFSQYWWPIQAIGPVQQANEKLALACSVLEDRTIHLGLCASSRFEGKVLVHQRDETLLRTTVTLAPGETWTNDELVFHGEHAKELVVQVISHRGEPILVFRPVDRNDLVRQRTVAEPMPEPETVATNDALFVAGEHLEQYRHPTRSPERYWLEAISRDPGDSRCRTALGKRALLRGELAAAHEHFATAIKRLTSHHPNPVTGEAHYYFGLTSRWMEDWEDAYCALHKAAWNYEWRSCAYYQLATIDCRRREWANALRHLEASLDTNRLHNKAYVLKAMVLQEQSQIDGRLGCREASELLKTVLESDPLDHWARYAYLQSMSTGREKLLAEFLDKTRNDAQTTLDLAFDFGEAGFHERAIALLELHHANEVRSVAVPNPLERSAMTHYALAWFKSLAHSADVDDALATARSHSPDFVFPSRLEEMLVLQWASDQPGGDPVAWYGMGNFLYDRRRHDDAIAYWQRAADGGTKNPQVFRNLGIAYWNVMRDGARAAAAYDRALQLDGSDARLVAEYDQLAKKRSRAPGERLEFLEAHRELVLRRDDATVELAGLYNLTGRPAEALQLIMSRRFHPWEGGEGAVLRQYTTARLLLGRAALDRQDPATAHREFAQAMDTPPSLGEAYHPLQAKADVSYWLGRSLSDLGRAAEANDFFRQSAEEAGDFADMAVTEFSPRTYYRALSYRELGRNDDARGLLCAMLDYAEKKRNEHAEIDYFATSLPNLLVFDEDLQSRRNADCNLLAALAHAGLEEWQQARERIEDVLAFDQSNQQAAELLLRLEQ